VPETTSRSAEGLEDADPVFERRFVLLPGLAARLVCRRPGREAARWCFIVIVSGIRWGSGGGRGLGACLECCQADRCRESHEACGG
jgi:hypothetical protein